MEIGGPSAGTNYHIPSADGTFRLNDLVSAADKVFSSDSLISAVSAEYSHILLFNPPASGITGLIDLIALYDSGSGFYLSWHNVVLATDNGVWKTRSDVADDGVIKTYQDTTGGLLGTPWLTTSSLSGSFRVIPFIYPLRLSEGKGVLVTPLSSNKSLRVHFEGREV